MQNVTDLANYSIEQERVIQECEAKRSGLVTAITEAGK